MLHAHINHGESDKQSMASNNAKAYDRVFVAGEAAVQRHIEGLLDVRHPPAWCASGGPSSTSARTPLLAPTTRRTVLYAPTWEGDADYNDYTSVDTIGTRIVAAILAVPDVRLVYKPHPKVTTSLTPAVQEGHLAILQLVAEAAAREPGAGHTSVLRGDILAVMPDCDAMVTDVSSVGLDWLYLRTEAPILITDRHQDTERFRQEVPVSRCADVVDESTVAGLTDLRRLAARPRRAPPGPAGDAALLLRRHPGRRQHDPLPRRGGRAGGAARPAAQQQAARGRDHGLTPHVRSSVVGIRVPDRTGATPPTATHP